MGITGLRGCCEACLHLTADKKGGLACGCLYDYAGDMVAVNGNDYCCWWERKGVVEQVVELLKAERWPLLIEDVDGAQWHAVAKKIVRQVLVIEGEGG